MKKKQITTVILICMLVLLLSSCASNVAPRKNWVWPANTIDVHKSDFTVLGPVTAERQWKGFVGVALPANIRISPELFLVSIGGINYSDVIEEARKIFPEADAVIDMKSSYRDSWGFIFYARRTEIVTGIAIKYATEQKNARAHLGGIAVVEIEQ